MQPVSTDVAPHDLEPSPRMERNASNLRGLEFLCVDQAQSNVGYFGQAGVTCAAHILVPTNAAFISRTS
jgi:hypothetical protein